MSRVLQKLDFCIRENKTADQLLISAFVCYIDSTIPLLPKSVQTPEYRFSCIAAQIIFPYKWTKEE